ncbi:hypothetical protein DICPUDRAFT_148527 [Dictyostelium purpureum]|uniref:Uncharacterized protein n=1 Tax=Dictyostelium purpureum TaxID=5786 RepID=F0ZBC6_DICPU|nr:uncharacterized protein DICPUDRAFT_148527 [Dictyostelium purpureum]EGC38722.1 hypothetical protein DICPUDRAFT_148527 [Dictyostelium purpureum]|eukprot:XP_003284713.1 hypothetical protein DICPUDRAFT_148527 [Dictyostelium purpureum]
MNSINNNNNKNNSSNNNNNNNNGDNSNKCSKKFGLIWENKILRNKIIFFRDLNNDWRKKNINFILEQQFQKQEYYSNCSIEQQEQQFYYSIESAVQFVKETPSCKNIVLNYIYSKEKLIKFMKLLGTSNGLGGSTENSFINAIGNSIYSIWFRNDAISIHINELELPLSVRELNLEGLEIRTLDLSPSSIFTKLFGSSNRLVEIFSSPFYNIVSLDLGQFNEPLLSGKHLSNAVFLQYLALNCQFKCPISKGMLPGQNLKVLSIQSNYRFTTIYLPKSLKELEFKGRSYNQIMFEPDILDCIPKSVESIRMIYCLSYYQFFFKKNLVNSLKKITINNPTIKEKNSLRTLLIHFDCNISSSIDIKKRRPPTLTTLAMTCTAGPLQVISISLLPPSLTVLKLPYNLLLSTDSASGTKGFPGSITDFEGTLSHLSSNFEKPQNIESLSIIITKVYTRNNNDRLNLYEEEDTNENQYINIYENNQLFHRFTNLKSLILKIEETNLISEIPTPIENLEIGKFGSNRLIKTTSELNNSSFQKLFDFNLKHLSNLKSLKLDDYFSQLFLDSINSIPSQLSSCTQEASSPFPASLLLLEINFNLASSRDLGWFFTSDILSSIQVIIIKGKHNPEIRSLPKSIEYLFIQDINPILNDRVFMKKYSSIVRDFNIVDQHLLYNKLKEQINNYFN